MDNIESVAKEAILTLFIETVEPYLINFDAKTLNKINRWVCKITTLNVHSMKTHLLLLNQMMKKGELSPPFSNEPENTFLPQFEPAAQQSTSNPNLDRILRLFTESKTSSSQNNRNQSNDPNVRYARSLLDFSTDQNSNCLDEQTFNARIPRSSSVNTWRNFTIPQRRNCALQSRLPALATSSDRRTYIVEPQCCLPGVKRPSDGSQCRVVGVKRPIVRQNFTLDPICIPERNVNTRSRSVPSHISSLQIPNCVEKADRCARSRASYEPAYSTSCRREACLPNFSSSCIRPSCSSVSHVPRSRSLPRRLSDAMLEEDLNVPRIPPRSRFPICPSRYGSAETTIRRQINENDENNPYNVSQNRSQVSVPRLEFKSPIPRPTSRRLSFDDDQSTQIDQNSRPRWHFRLSDTSLNPSQRTINDQSYAGQTPQTQASQNLPGTSTPLRSTPRLPELTLSPIARARPRRLSFDDDDDQPIQPVQNPRPRVPFERWCFRPNNNQEFSSSRTSDASDAQNRSQPNDSYCNPAMPNRSDKIPDHSTCLPSDEDHSNKPQDPRLAYQSRFRFRIPCTTVRPTNNNQSSSSGTGNLPVNECCPNT